MTCYPTLSIKGHDFFANGIFDEKISFAQKPTFCFKTFLYLYIFSRDFIGKKVGKVGKTSKKPMNTRFVCPLLVKKWSKSGRKVGKICQKVGRNCQISQIFNKKEEDMPPKNPLLHKSPEIFRKKWAEIS